MCTRQSCSLSEVYVPRGADLVEFQFSVGGSVKVKVRSVVYRYRYLNLIPGF